jgi:hypothetical protein
LGKEVIGYDSMDEAIELTRYYLDREEERREIAVAGWRRTLRDYNEVASFDFIRRAVDAYRSNATQRASSVGLESSLRLHVDRTKGKRAAYAFVRPAHWVARQSVRVTLGVLRRLSLYRANLALRASRLRRS